MNFYENYQFLQAEFPWLLSAIVFALGAIVGSFLNVCIYRIPVGMSVINPGSRCGACGSPIKPWHNVPIVSWIVLRGKAACCGAPFSVRYAGVELLTGLCFLWAWLALDPVVALIGMGFVSILIATTFIDFDHMIIPLRFSVGGMFLGVFLSILFPQVHGVTETGILGALQGGVFSIIGVLVGSAVIYWIRLLAEIILGREAMGEGDVMFMGCIGAFCGWQGGLFAIFGGSTIGTVLLIPALVYQRLRGKAPTASSVPEIDSAEALSAAVRPGGGHEADDTPETGIGLGLAIPFGPMLALGGWLYFVWLGPWVRGYFAPFIELF